MLGSAIPSSRYLIAHLTELIDWENTKVVVEYGPGIGNMTQEILRRMRPDATLVAIELNREFVEHLRASIRDPRAHIVHGSAAEVRAILAQLNLAHADYIISGIPYTVLPPVAREDILRESYSALRPCGAFVVYQFTRAVLPDLRRVFGSVRQGFEPRNFLPARLFYCMR